MTVTVDNLEGQKIDVTEYLGRLSFESSLDEIYSTLKFDLPHFIYSSKKVKIFSRVTAKSGSDFEFSGIVISTLNDDLKKVTLEAVSDSFYLTIYEDIFKVKNFAADKVIKQVITNYDSSFEVECIPLQTPITQIYKGKTIIEVIDDVLSQSEGANAKKLYRTFENNKLTVFSDPTPYKLKIENSLSNLRLSYDGEDIKTRVKVFTEDNKNIAVESVKENSELIKKAGVIQKVYEIKAKDKAEADLVASNLLEIYGKIKKTGSFTLFGDYKARVGMGVTVEGDEYIISSLKHSFDDEIHLMSVGVIRYG